MILRHRHDVVYAQFQCSSASRKFLNSDASALTSTGDACFSALQRAENSSILSSRSATTDSGRFQCSSASRKFLNLLADAAMRGLPPVSVLFSEPKIPQLIGSFPRHRGHTHVSVLFSEPKIPQSFRRTSTVCGASTFQCSSASRKFLNIFDQFQSASPRLFQCSSASRKYLNSLIRGGDEMSTPAFQCSSASRKFLNCIRQTCQQSSVRQFQCSSASRKFLNDGCMSLPVTSWMFQCSSASRKFLN